MKRYIVTIVYYLLSLGDSTINLVLSLFNLSMFRVDIASGFLFMTESSRIEKELQERFLKREEMHEDALNKVDGVRKEFKNAKTIRSEASRYGREPD